MEGEDPVVRKAKLEDAPALAALNQTVHKLHVDRLSGLFREPSLGETTRAMQTQLERENTFAFVAEVGDDPVGYILMRSLSWAEGPFTFARDFILIDQISVEPEWRGRGIGSELLKAVESWGEAHGIRAIELESWAFNTGAHRFFEAKGYQIQRLRFEKRT